MACIDVTNELVAAFRESIPFFCSQTTWPRDVIAEAICEADEETGGCRWGPFVNECCNLKRRGMFAYAAFLLSTEHPNGAAEGSNMNPSASWAVQQKSVGDESVTFNNGDLSSMNVNDAALAANRWGQKFLRLRRRVGMGALAV